MYYNMCTFVPETLNKNNMIDKIPLSEYAKKHNIHYKTALRKFKEETLEGVVKYIIEPAGEFSIRYFVLDETKDYKQTINNAKDAVNSVLDSVNKLKKNFK